MKCKRNFLRFPSQNVMTHFATYRHRSPKWSFSVFMLYYSTDWKESESDAVRVPPTCGQSQPSLCLYPVLLQIFMHGNNLNSLHQLIHPEILPSELGGMMPPYDMGTWARTLLDHAYDEETDYCPESYTLSVQDLERDLEKNLSPKTMKRSAQLLYGRYLSCRDLKQQLLVSCLDSALIPWLGVTFYDNSKIIMICLKWDNHSLAQCWHRVSLLP